MSGGEFTSLFRMLPSVVPSQLGSSSSEVGSQSCVSHGAQGLLFRIQLPEQSVHLCLLPHTTLVARRIPPRLSQKLLMPFAVGAVCSTSARVMQGQADHGPVATSAPRAVPFPPAFSLPQSQHYGLPLRPLEPPPQGFAPLYPQPRPDGKRIRPRKGKSAQERRRRSSKNAATKPGLNSMLKANRQRTRKHFPREYVNCTCCGHLKALYCLGPGFCADADGVCDTGLAETPKNLTHGVPCDVSHLAISEALKPGTSQLLSTVLFTCSLRILFLRLSFLGLFLAS